MMVWCLWELECDEDVAIDPSIGLIGVYSTEEKAKEARLAIVDDWNSMNSPERDENDYAISVNTIE